jgi:predicted SAM-dependent methyltransferase
MARQRLHIGCGPQRMEGWVNIDNQPYPGVDAVVDVTLGLPFEDVELVFAEHFIEHLSLDDARNFLRECRRVLAADGILRLSTPNLDWVWATHYHRGEWSSDEHAMSECFSVNRAFRGWGHQFLYNRPTLEALLQNVGFATMTWLKYGESEHDALRGIERHETWQDAPDLPHVLVVEASGIGERAPLPEGLLPQYWSAVDVS